INIAIFLLGWSFGRKAWRAYPQYLRAVPPDPPAEPLGRRAAGWGCPAGPVLFPGVTVPPPFRGRPVLASQVPPGVAGLKDGSKAQRALKLLNDGAAKLKAGRGREAEPDLRQARALFEELAADSPGTPDYEINQTVALQNLAAGRL